MSPPLRVAPGELDAESILEALHDGRRIVVSVPALDDDHEVTLRFSEGTYYCDTPTTLHRHQDVEEMRACMQRMGYVAEAAD